MQLFKIFFLSNPQPQFSLVETKYYNYVTKIYPFYVDLKKQLDFSPKYNYTRLKITTL